MGNLSSPASAGGPGSRVELPDPYLRLQSVNIFVRDLDRSIRFYVDQLGFSLVFESGPQSERRWAAVAPPDGLTTLTLVVPDADSDEYNLIGRSTQVSFVTEDVIAKFRAWRRQGVQFLYTPRLKRLKYPAPGKAPIWGGVIARFKDVDGNSFSLVSFDELSREIEEQRRAAAAKAEAERRAAQELEIAKQVQARLFPQTLPPLRTLDYAGLCLQARQVGGDYYDFLSLGRGQLGLVIADISGKGIAAALLMANLQANLRSQCAIALDQAQQFLQSVNQRFYENTSDIAYATLFFAEYDDPTQQLKYVNCGHLSALLLRRDGTLERLESTSTVLGLFAEWDCTVGERRLFPGDTLALYTDGITEAFNEAEDQFGEPRLIAALQRHCHLPSQAMLASVVDEVQEFSPHEQHDDITLVVAKCQESAPESLPA
jgi:phosphoserine phosphatase RsbU/P